MYEQCEPGKLISRQQSTMIYLSKTRHLEKNRDVIIKTIEKEKIAESALAIDFAKKESAIHLQMDHPNIAKVYHYTETDESYCMFMEYLGFGSAYLSKKVLLSNKPVREDKLQCWATDVLQAIWYLHERGVIHTDIKIDNILIQTQPEEGIEQQEDELPMAKVIDFGLCNVVSNWDREKPAGHQLTYLERVVGTQDYQAPEVKNESWITPAIDMWSYGIVLYEMAVGYKPQKIKDLGLPQLTGNVSYFKKHWLQKDPNLLDLIKRCLHEDPSKRITA